MKLSNIVEFNPTRNLKKGEMASFVEMASLPTYTRNISNIFKKKFLGSGSKFKNGDTLFARITPCLENGKTALVTELDESEVAHGSTEFIVLSAKNPEIDRYYIYYLARLPEFRKYAQSRMEGTSGRQRVSWQSLAEFEFAFPEEALRQKAGQILSIFDNKIQLNTETNQTLEAIAQAIFKHWFIDFAPVHAKAEALAKGKTAEQVELAAMASISGKTEADIIKLANSNPQAYQQLQQTAAAFPSEFVESEMGLVPKGWEVKPIGEILERLKNTQKLKKEDIIPVGSIPVFEQGQSILMGFHNGEAAFQATENEPIFIFGDHTCITHLSMKPFSIYQNVIPLKGKNIPTLWVYLAIQKKQIFQEYRRHWMEFIIHNICIPNERFIINRFVELIKPLFSKKDFLSEQNQTLAQTRDTLLPKLLNGEVEL